FTDTYRFTGKASQQALLALSAPSTAAATLIAPGGIQFTGATNRLISLPSDGEYLIRIAADGDSSTQMLSVNYELSLTLSPATCPFNISSDGAVFEAAGGEANIAVKAGGDCAWVATAGADWIKVKGSGAGAGDGQVTFSVAPNTANSNSGSRRASLSVA